MSAMLGDCWCVGAMLGMCSLEDGRIAGVWVQCWVCAHLKMDGLLVWYNAACRVCAHLKMEGSMWYVAGVLAYRLEFIL